MHVQRRAREVTNIPRAQLLVRKDRSDQGSGEARLILRTHPSLPTASSIQQVVTRNRYLLSLPHTMTVSYYKGRNIGDLLLQTRPREPTAPPPGNRTDAGFKGCGHRARTCCKLKLIPSTAQQVCTPLLHNMGQVRDPIDCNVACRCHL